MEIVLSDSIVNLLKKKLILTGSEIRIEDAIAAFLESEAVKFDKDNIDNTLRSMTYEQKKTLLEK